MQKERRAVKKAKLRQFRFTVAEAGEALADYIKKKDGEQVGIVAGFNINLDTEKSLIVLTVVDLSASGEEPTGITPSTSGIDGSGGVVN